MSRIIDLKKLGISQDIGEMKSSEAKEKKSKYYNQDIEKKKLSLMEEAHRIKYSSNASEENKATGLNLIDKGKIKVREEEGIAKQKQKIYEHSFRGKLEKKVGKVLDRANKALDKRVISRRILRKSNAQVVIDDYKAPSVLGDENRFFKGEMEKTKKSMFFE